jgi:hypothetical protein
VAHYRARRYLGGCLSCLARIAEARIADYSIPQVGPSSWFLVRAAREAVPGASCVRVLRYLDFRPARSTPTTMQTSRLMSAYDFSREG